MKESPVSVMVCGLLEKALCPKILNELFECSAKTQYTRELLFSTVVNLMSLVVCGVHPSVHVAHQASSIDAPYEPPINPEIVCYTAKENIKQSINKVIEQLEKLDYIPARQTVNGCVTNP